MPSGELAREKERRAWVERHERLRDLEEDYELRVKAGVTPEERERLGVELSTERRKSRELDVALGKRSAGGGVAGRQNMWARWIEIAVEHELEARAALAVLRLDADGKALARELHASLVAVTAAASTIEGLYGEIKYLIERQPRRDKRYLCLRDAFAHTFGLDAAATASIERDLRWLFELRDWAMHPYTETLPMEPHPAGTTGASSEHARFNGVTSSRAVEVAIRILDIARTPPGSANAWIARWARDNEPYHAVIDTHRERRMLGVP